MKILLSPYYWVMLVTIQVVMAVVGNSLIAMGFSPFAAFTLSMIFGIASLLWMYWPIAEIHKPQPVTK